MEASESEEADWSEVGRGKWQAGLPEEEAMTYTTNDGNVLGRLKGIRTLGARLSVRISETAQTMTRRSFKRSPTQQANLGSGSMESQTKPTKVTTRFSASRLFMKNSTRGTGAVPDMLDQNSTNRTGEMNFQRVETVCRGMGAEPSNRTLNREKETYQVYPGRVELLASLMTIVCKGSWEFRVGQFFIRCHSESQVADRGVLYERSNTGTTKPESIQLRMYSEKEMPKQIQDHFSAACMEAERTGSNGAVVFDSFTDMIPLSNKIILNVSNFGVARAADYAYQLYLSEGSFQVDEDSVPQETRSRCLRFAKNVSELLVAVGNIPSVFPVAHLGSFASSTKSGICSKYSPTVPAVSPITTKALSKKLERYLLASPYTVVEDLPRVDLEVALLREIEFMEDQAGLYMQSAVHGESLLLQSVLFEYYVGGARFPDPNTSFHLTLSFIMDCPVVDRAEVFVNRNVKTTILHPLPEYLADAPVLLRQGKINQMKRAEKAQRKRIVADFRDDASVLSHISETDSVSAVRRLVSESEVSGLHRMFKRTAKKVLKRAKVLGVQAVQVLWDGRPGSTAILLALLSLDPNAFRRDRLTLKVSYLRDAQSRFEAFAEVFLSERSRGSWEGILEPYLWEEDHGIREKEELNLEAEYTERISSQIILQDIMDLENNLVVTAEHWEEIFGLSHPLLPLTKRQSSESWEMVMRNHIKEMGLLNPGLVEPFMKELKRHADLAPFELCTMREYSWWMNFTCRWQYEDLRLLLQRPDMNTELSERLFQFYSGEDWQIWAMDPDNHKELKSSHAISKKNKLTATAHLKGYIFDRVSNRIDSTSCHLYFSKDEDLPSPEICPPSSSYFAIDDTFHIIRFGANSHSVEDLRHAFDDTLDRFLS